MANNLLTITGKESSMKGKIIKSLLIIAFASALAGGAAYLLFERTGEPRNIILNSNLNLYITGLESEECGMMLLKPLL